MELPIFSEAAHLLNLVMEKSTLIQFTASITSAIAVVFGILTAQIATRANRAKFRNNVVIYTDENNQARAKIFNEPNTAQLEKETRISDVRHELAKQEFKAKWAAYSSTALKFSQYIIGGLLASSFIQESVDPKYIGSLGVVVLVASLVNQHFKPDVRHRGSKQRATQLKALLRNSEDHVYAIKNEVNGAKSLFDIRRNATKGLNQIEEMELLDNESNDDRIETS